MSDSPPLPLLELSDIEEEEERQTAPIHHSTPITSGHSSWHYSTGAAALPDTPGDNEATPLAPRHFFSPPYRFVRGSATSPHPTATRRLPFGDTDPFTESTLTAENFEDSDSEPEQESQLPNLSVFEKATLREFADDKSESESEFSEV